MQVIKKRRIVLASVLKPVDETRMFEKIGITLAGTKEYDVTIIGYPSTIQPAHPSIDFIPLKRFTRFSLNRLLAQWKIFQLIHQVKPEIIIINTPELLIVAFLNRILFGRKIVYDVLENYYRNIRFTPAFPNWTRLLLANVVRIMETVSNSFVSLYIHAEKGYTSELTFAKPFIVAENKLPKVLAEQFIKPHVHDYHRLLFTGTLAPTTGVLDAINLCKALHKIDSSYNLSIVGYCAMPAFLNQIKSEILGLDFIKLIGGDELVPHSEILSQITKADAGIVIYSVNSSTESSIPTKVYEYLALKLPVLIRHNDESQSLVKNLHGGIILPQNVDYEDLNRQLKNISSAETDSTLYWDQEGEKIVNALKLL